MKIDNVLTLVERLTELEQEEDQITKLLCDRAAEYYRIHSGRSHFHRLEFLYRDDEWLLFSTPIREDYIYIRVPLEWF